MLFQIQSYLKFWLKSTNQHDVHSPFVYSLITNCFYDKASKTWYKKIGHYRQQLLKNPATILVQDFGAGSKKLQNNERAICQIAQKAGISLKRAQLLGRIINFNEIETILEIGTSLGIATASMSFANPKVTITTLEGCEQTAGIAADSFDKFDIQNVQLIIGNFNQTLPKVLENKAFDLIYFDGNHEKSATINYFEQCLSTTTNNTIFIFDDIYWSKGMQEAWKFIIDHPKVTVSIDTFYWGIVFFRKEQPKQHFTIRL